MRFPWSWGTGVTLAYVLFAAGTLGVVVFAVERRVDLVSPDYYEQSLREDQQMAAVRNGQALHAAAAIVQAGDRAVMVSLPPEQSAEARGTVVLYRASDATADRTLTLKTDGRGRQEIALDGLKAGLWLVQVRWSAQGREFYLERRVTVR